MFGDVEKNSKGYEMILLQEIGTCLSGGTPSTSFAKYYKGNIPWITTISLGKTYIDKDDAVALITEEAVSHSATKIIEPNSILFGTRVGVGKSSINKVPMCTNQDIAAITNISKNYNSIFLKEVLEKYSNYFERQKRGTTIKGIKLDVLKNIKIPIVDITIQKKYEELVKLIDKQKFNYIEKIKLLNKLKNIQGAKKNE